MTDFLCAVEASGRRVMRISANDAGGAPGLVVDPIHYAAEESAVSGGLGLAASAEVISLHQIGSIRHRVTSRTVAAADRLMTAVNALSDRASRELALAYVCDQLSGSPQRLAAFEGEEADVTVWPAHFALDGKDTLIDVGSADGGALMSLQFAGTEPDRYVAFEVDPTLAQILEGRISHGRQKSADAVRLLPLSRATRELEMILIPGTGASHVGIEEHDRTLDWTGCRTLRMTASTLDQEFTNPVRGMLCIDAEGHDLDVISGGSRLLKASRLIVSVAVYHQADDLGSVYESLSASLIDYCYFLRRLGNNGLSAEQRFASRYLDVHLVAVPIERCLAHSRHKVGSSPS
ncbi:hypothetical protein [Terracoccus luteus]|uniref:FkbM family methyltransferase n=1 Tax=Terracoccus luteus TaxID=53356 RepID=A0A839Q2N4_9MICO|nr:hypothetical protein [Terracoccus luteus]MBB2988526.1 FkbM family methyltransferase [Terracoccus luteus]MCP2174176.1 FkbM family methyltransferase [Terracoccus luteus]